MGYRAPQGSGKSDAMGSKTLFRLTFSAGSASRITQSKEEPEEERSTPLPYHASINVSVDHS